MIGANKRFAQHYQFFANYTWSRNFGNASSERDTETFYGPQDPFNLNLDYGRDGLDITHQLKGGIVVDLPKGFNWSSNFIIHSGLAYPAYSVVDLNGDAVINQFANNDRPTVQIGSGKAVLAAGISRTPAGFLQLGHADREGHHVQGALQRALLGRPLQRDQLQQPVLESGRVRLRWTRPPTSAAHRWTPRSTRTSSARRSPPIPNPKNTPGYRTLDQLAPGATAFGAQFGARFQF